MRVSRKEVIKTLAQMTEEPPVFRDSWEEELKFFSDMLGGYDNFVNWKEDEIFLYLKGVLDGMELYYNWGIDWEDDE